MSFPDLHPPTLLSQNSDKLTEFVHAQEGRAVLKPWDGNGGKRRFGHLKRGSESGLHD